MTKVAYLSIHNKRITDKQISLASEGKFDLTGGEFQFDGFPIDWNMNPYQDRSWCFWLHSLFFLEVLFQAHIKHSTLENLIFAKEVVLDWIEQNSQEADGVSKFAWYDMAVAARAAYFSYLIKIGHQENILNDDEQQRILNSLILHGEYLEEDSKYAWKHNHGLYSDAGLYIMASQVPELSTSEHWLCKAQARFIQTVKDCFTQEGVHKEHSPVYHMSVTALIARLSKVFQANSSGVRELNDIISKAQQVAQWLIMPDGKYPQLGDTYLDNAPSWVKQTDSEIDYQVFSEAGYAVCKKPESYLIFASGYHSQGHKHADDLSFCLYDCNERIIVDTGVYGYYYTDPGRIYAVSSAAHNTLTVDCHDTTWKKQEIYGSGIQGGCQQDDWYIFWGENPLIKQYEVEHSRILCYKPQEILIILDLVENNSSEQLNRDYQRYWHFAPHIQVNKQSESVLKVVGHNFEGIFKEFTIDRSEISIVRGQKEPEIQGFTFPKNRTWIENSVAIVKSSSNQNKPYFMSGLIMRNKDFWHQVELKTLDVNGNSYQIHFTNGYKILFTKVG